MIKPMKLMEKVFYYLFFLFVLVFAGTFFFVYLPLDVITQDRCLAAGWTRGEITLNLDQFCVRRVDGTDEVMRLQ